MSETSEPELSDDRLATILASIGDHLVVPDPEGLVGPIEPNGSSPSTSPTPSDDNGATGSDPSDDDGDANGDPNGDPATHKQTNWPRRLLVAAAIAILVTATTLVVTPVRQAVADWLGIGSTGVERVGAGEGDPSDLPYLADDLVPVDEATAEHELGKDLPDTTHTELGVAPVLAIPPEGGVVMAWPQADTTLWVQSTQMSAHDTVEKLLTVDDDFERVDGVGDDAAVIEGPHVLVTPLRRLAAGTVLIWVDGDEDLRLESDHDPAEMEDIARTIANERG
jgi:hypothetical protein